ncbi:cytotoxic T-lymphocyte protein 4 [Cynoglossus semilaevis]|uniref:cytotoxic T-lymphocyte protein 4 n=1 Tax=Cynoglossus semilaevis TaxID=244447 RepID=UPI000D62F9E8|nr:cytotoxic T-lymphocyte protein 4-like [Cynoglossus semilaevis]
MYLIHYMMGWIALTVLNMFFLPVWSELKVSQPYKVMAVNGTAKVQCLIDPQPSYNDVYSSANQNFKYPYPNPQEIRVTLIKGLHSSHRFCSNTLNFTDHRWVDMAKHGQCSAVVTEDGLELTVSGLQAIHTDLYRCKIEVMYPPPYLRLTGNATLIHVLESPECPAQEQQGHMLHLRDKEDGDIDQEFQVGPPVVVLATLVMFVLIVIIFIQAIQCQQQRRYALGTSSNRYC